MTEHKMKFPHGIYEDFNEKNIAVFELMKQRFENYAMSTNTAIILPMDIREHIDHFIACEAGIAKKLDAKTNDRFYFQEDKPKGGIASETDLERIEEFKNSNHMQSK
ncbi:MAG: hypothetical protein QM485_15245 [Flavobacteriaceae bacterium]